MKSLKITTYLGGFNVIDIVSLLLNIYLLVEQFRNSLDTTETTNLAIVVIVLMWWNFIYWMRLFETT